MTWVFIILIWAICMIAMVFFFIEQFPKYFDRDGVKFCGKSCVDECSRCRLQKKIIKLSSKGYSVALLWRDARDAASIYSPKPLGLWSSEELRNALKRLEHV